MSDTPSPLSLKDGLVNSGLAKLAKIGKVDLKEAHTFKVGQTVQLASANEPHLGTVSHITDLGFQVTYQKTGRKHGQPRERHWYRWHEARHFQPVSNG